MFGFGTRAAAVFLLAMSTIGLKSGVFPPWFGRAGYIVGLMLLLVVAVWDWVILVLPAWVALISLYILRRERARRRTA
jgi:membrane protein implicated in regulation of membrane protease activity